MRNPEICRELLQRILPELDIDRIEYQETQKSIQPDVDARSVRLDVYVKQLIDKGQSYKKLNQSYIIFICPFDLYGKGRHIYTFDNTCKEDTSIYLKDGTTKIFLNSKGKMDDISRELKAFLDYTGGKKPEDAFVKKLEEAVEKAKQNREWRHEYMTLLMRDQENLEKGMEKGILPEQRSSPAVASSKINSFALWDSAVLIDNFIVIPRENVMIFLLVGI